MTSIPPPIRLFRAILSAFIIGLIIAPLLLSASDSALAETYIFGGSVRSKVHIIQTTNIQASNINSTQITNGSKFIYNATYPASSSTGGYSASYSNVQISASPAPSSVSGIMTDQFGNQYKQYEWDSDKITGPNFNIAITTSFDADITGDMSPLSYSDAIGTDAYSEFRAPTTMVQSDASAIINKKNNLLSGATTEADAVDRIINYVRVTIPNQDPNQAKDAVSSMSNANGNCVNRAHLALALLRSAGIPARCVSGYLYGDKYSVSYPVTGGTATREITWGSGSHVWIEVYYPNAGAWVAYDPWMDKGFVDSRHIKFTTSKDFDSINPSTRGDGGLLYVSGLSPTVLLSTSVSSSNLKDTISAQYKYMKNPPSGIFMAGRQMTGSWASTPTAAPSITPTPTPYNATVTPTALPGNSTPTVTVTARPTAGGNGGPVIDYAKHNLTGVIVDASTGAPVKGATVLLDTLQLSASDDGKFSFLYAVSNGSYVLSVSAPGYLTEDQSIKPNNADMNMTIKLSPLAASPTARPGSGLLPAPGLLAVLAALACGALLWRKKAP